MRRVSAQDYSDGRHFEEPIPTIAPRDELTRATSSFAHEQARAEIPLVDTATENWVLRNSFLDGWNDLRRGQDYYDEGALIWLRADTIIRERTQGQKSLDDFLRSFLGQRDTDPIVAPYSREDVEAALGAICPYDWHEFFESRITRRTRSLRLKELRPEGGA